MEGQMYEKHTDFFFLEHNWLKSAGVFCSIAATALLQRIRTEGLSNSILCHCPIKKRKIKFLK